MSDESAFLAALRANPADDTVRLVYADWLDERDEPHRAAYLRAVVDLTTLAAGSPEYADAAGRLYAAAVQTDSAWRAAVGGRFDLVLAGYEPTKKVQTIKVIREVTGMGLAEAKAMSESAPTPLYSWRPFEILLPQLLAFEAVGTTGRGRSYGADLRITPTVWPAGTGPETVFDVVLHRHTLSIYQHHHSGGSPDSPFFSWGVQSLAGLLGIAPAAAAMLLDNLPKPLARGVKPKNLAELMRRLKMIFNVSTALPPDAIQIIPRSAETT
jgi:uncharacterized protein (TIGR02996 family)